MLLVQSYARRDVGHNRFSGTQGVKEMPSRVVFEIP